MSEPGGSGHLDDAQLTQLMAGALDARSLEALEDHVDRCAACSELLIGLARAAGPAGDGAGLDHPAADGDPRGSGSTIGRYQVIRVLGRGGMGVVYAAYDPVLHRQVALKVVRPELDDQEAGTARLLAEARALAALAHPNVVAVHDAGELDGAVFVATELVAGRTVTEWVADEAPGLRDVVDVFRQAARGLIAAHAAGIIHRDIKPDNILVGDAAEASTSASPSGETTQPPAARPSFGRVRVADFGLASDRRRRPPSGALLARSAGSGSRTDRSDGGERASGSGGRAEPQGAGVLRGRLAAAALTRTGDVLGTPLYMAPEQLAGEAADARADQFAFCVSLYEARYRHRPFAGRTVAELAENVRAGRIREVELASEEARRLHAVMVRGLAARPADRYVDMSALLAALDGLVAPAPPVRRWWVGPAVFAAAALLAVGVMAVTREKPRQAAAPPPVTGTASASGAATVLHGEVASLVARRDPACRDVLARADAAGPAPYDDALVRARCVMLAGDCTAGKQAVRAAQVRRGLAPVAADAEALRESRQFCSPLAAGDPWPDRVDRMPTSVQMLQAQGGDLVTARQLAAGLRALVAEHGAEMIDAQRFAMHNAADILADVLATRGECAAAREIRQLGLDITVAAGVDRGAWAATEVQSDALRACLQPAP